MNETTSYYTELITRYLAGEASEEEMNQLVVWIGESADNELLFREMSLAANYIDEAVVEQSLDIEQAWRQLQQKTTGRARITLPLKAGKTRSIHWLRIASIAAVFLVVVMSVWVWDNLSSGPDWVTIAADGSRCPYKLPDGTLVVLNRGSLSYPEEFAANQREVTLSGEGWFEVAPDSASPFVVATGTLRLMVLGTKFYFDSQTAGEKATVVLEEGKVALYHIAREQDAVILAPGEKAAVAHDEITKTTNTNKNYIAWKTGRITFSNQPLSEVTEVLSKVYEKQIVLSNSALANCKLTADFDQASLDAILQIIATTLDLQVSYHNQTIVLSGKGCR